MKNFVQKYVLFIVLGVFLFGGVIAYAPQMLTAKTVQDLMSEGQKLKKSGLRTDALNQTIEETIFPDNIDGCVNKFKFFTLAKLQYQSGTPVSEIGGIKAVESVFEDAYEGIRKDGVQNAMYGAMKDLDSCMSRGGKITKAAIRNNYKGCAALNHAMIDVISSIQRRQSVETVMGRYQNKSINLVDTTYENTEDPLMMFVGMMYKVSKAGDENASIDAGYNFVMNCLM